LHFVFVVVALISIFIVISIPIPIPISIFIAVAITVAAPIPIPVVPTGLREPQVLRLGLFPRRGRRRFPSFSGRRLGEAREGYKKSNRQGDIPRGACFDCCHGVSLVRRCYVLRTMLIARLRSGCR
jgi:hypothetical protein